MYTDAQRKEFNEISDQMIKWLNDNCHPHTSVIVTVRDAEVVEGCLVNVNHGFIKD